MATKYPTRVKAQQYKTRSKKSTEPNTVPSATAADTVSKENAVINKPNYYQIEMMDPNGHVHNCQAVDIMEAVAPADIHLAHVIPYLVRAGKKNINGKGGAEARLEDLKKARWWLTRAIIRAEQAIEIETNSISKEY